MKLLCLREFTAAETPIRTSYNTRSGGQKVRLDVGPELVCRRLLADLGACAEGFGGKLSWHPWFQREKRLLEAAFQAENPLHAPCESVAAANADRFRVLEVGCG